MANNILFKFYYKNMVKFNILKISDKDDKLSSNKSMMKILFLFP